MKKALLIAAVIVCLAIIVLSFVLTSRQAPIPAGYDVLFRKSLGDGLVMYGLAASAAARADPLSLIAVYHGQDLVYRYSPVVPASLNYPRPLMVEKAVVVRARDGELLIVTSWGETGADYWGTHPIVIQSCGGKFRAASFTWTRRGFKVSNLYDAGEVVRTILTQGVSVNRDHQVELSFYGDDLPRAAEHKMITIRVPLVD
ncbi:hypothetical protein ACFL37_01265 [Candidatus Margulisiibacteriota bacterium]